LVKKVIFAAVLVLLSANSSFAFWNFHKVITHSEPPQPLTLDKAHPKAMELPDASSLLDPEREAAGRVEDLSKAETYACPIDLSKPYSLSSAAGDDVPAVDGKQCTGGMP
jgi:hypothetical protein